MFFRCAALDHQTVDLAFSDKHPRNGAPVVVYVFHFVGDALTFGQAHKSISSRVEAPFSFLWGIPHPKDANGAQNGLK